jgi:hypothetical protein
MRGRPGLSTCYANFPAQVAVGQGAHVSHELLAGHGWRLRRRWNLGRQ